METKHAALGDDSTHGSRASTDDIESQDFEADTNQDPGITQSLGRSPNIADSNIQDSTSECPHCNHLEERTHTEEKKIEVSPRQEYSNSVYKLCMEKKTLSAIKILQ